MNNNLQEMLSPLGISYLGKAYEKILIKNGFSEEDLELFRKYGPYLFWYCGSKEFISKKRTSSDFEFNYLSMQFLRYGLLEIKDMALQRKMLDFITRQTAAKANDILIHIENIVSKEALKTLYKKIIRIKTDSKTKELYIIGGANGSGKSTLAQRILAGKELTGENFIFINADEIARELNPKNVDKVKISRKRNSKEIS